MTGTIGAGGIPGSVMRCPGVAVGWNAFNYAALGEKDKAFLWLDKAYASRSSFMTTLKYWSVFDPIRSDPRFSDSIRRVRLDN